MSGFTVTDELLECGATVQRLTAMMASQSDELVNTKDCTICVCNLNCKQEQDCLTFAEQNGIGIHIYNLCAQLLRYKRPVLILGGNLNYGISTRHGMTWCGNAS